MDVPFLQSDIYDKFDALQKRGAGSREFWDIVARGVLVLLVAVIVYLALRHLFRRLLHFTDRRGRGAWKPGASDVRLLEIGSEMHRRIHLSEIADTTTLFFFWEVGGLHCCCGGSVVKAEDDEITVEAESDSAPVAGEVRLVVPDADGNISFFDVTVTAAKGDRGRTLTCPEGLAAAYMDRSFRMGADVKAAVLPSRAPAEGDAAREGALVRILDVSLDGMGVRSEAALDEGGDVLVRAHFPGYLEPITTESKVVWSREERSGLHRAGLSISFRELETRLVVADYMYVTQRAERHVAEPVEA